MNVATKIEPQSTDIVIPSAQLVVAEPSSGNVVLFDRTSFDQFEAKLREDFKDFVPDLSTATSRKAIASKAFEVTKVKTTLEKQAKALTEEWRTKTNAVNAGRNVIVARLDAFADEVRKPLTDWQAAEDARIAECNLIMENLRQAAIVTQEDTVETVRDRGTRVYNTVIDAAKFGELAGAAESLKGSAVDILKAALARLVREEADKAELEKLRAANAEREAADLARQEAEDAKARQAERARRTIAHIRECANGMIGGQVQSFGLLMHELEERITIDESFGDLKAEAEDARADAIGTLNAKMEEARTKQIADAARLAADEALAAKQIQHDAELAAEKKRADELAAAEAERVATKAREDAEQAKRERNRAHRAQRMGEVKIAIMAAASAGHAVEHPITEAAAVAIVRAIVAGSIPHVSLGF